jgi:fatty acid desaturase
MTSLLSPLGSAQVKAFHRRVNKKKSHQAHAVAAPPSAFLSVAFLSLAFHSLAFLSLAFLALAFLFLAFLSLAFLSVARLQPP